MPLLPFAAIWGGLACDMAGRWLAERCHAWEKPALERFIIPGLVLLVGVSPFCMVLQDSYLFSLPDTRSVASEWIEKNLRRGTLVREEFTPQVQNLPVSQVRYDPWGIAKRELEASEAFDYLVISESMEEDCRRMQIILEAERMRRRRTRLPRAFFRLGGRGGGS